MIEMAISLLLMAATLFLIQDKQYDKMFLKSYKKKFEVVISEAKALKAH